MFAESQTSHPGQQTERLNTEVRFMQNYTQLCYGPRQVAKLIGVNPGMIYSMIKQGRIKAHRFGAKRLLISKEEIETLLKINEPF